MIEFVAARMAELGYVESAVEEILQLRPFTFRRSIHLPAYRRRWRSHGPLGLAVAFFLLQEWLSLEELRLLLKDEGIAAMHTEGFLDVGVRGIRSRVDLYPCMGAYFFTDSAFELEPWPEQVYWLGGDSYTLAYCTPRRAYTKTLDLCSGSGVHALLAGCPGLGVDINRRAVEFGRLNARLNGVSDVEFVQGDCLSASGQVDLVTLNPPFVPTPEGIAELYRTGGGSGEGITERVMRQLPDLLSLGGLFSMATEAPRCGPQSPLVRMREWLGPGWGLAGLNKFEFPIDDYIFSNILSSAVDSSHQEAEYERWLDSYEAFGITSMVSAQFFAVRLPDGCEDWTIERDFPHPGGPRGDLCGDWLRALQAWHSRWPADYVPHLRTPVFLGSEGGMAQLGSEWAEGPLPLSAAHCAVLAQIQRGTRLEEIQDQESLRFLGGQMVITNWTEK